LKSVYIIVNVPSRHGVEREQDWEKIIFFLKTAGLTLTTLDLAGLSATGQTLATDKHRWAQIPLGGGGP
jgi:hypothetical protein